MPSSWITALKQWNNQDSELHAPHKSLWAIPKKNTKSMEEVRAFMPRGGPGAAVIRHGSRKPTLAAQLNAETLTKLRTVEKETAERNAQRKRAETLAKLRKVEEETATRNVERKKAAENRAQQTRKEQIKKIEETELAKNYKKESLKLPQHETKDEDKIFIGQVKKPGKGLGKFIAITKADDEKIKQMEKDAIEAIRKSTALDIDKTEKANKKILMNFLNKIELRNLGWEATEAGIRREKRIEEEQNKTNEEKPKPEEPKKNMSFSMGEEWSKGRSYNKGDEVVYNGEKYRALRFTLTHPTKEGVYWEKIGAVEQPKAVAEAAKELIAETKEPLTKVGDYSYNATFFNDLDEIFDPANSRLSTKKVQELRKKIGVDVYDSFANFARYSDLYPTPLPEVRRIVSDMMRHLTDKEKKDGISVLEPSAGTGNIIRGVIDAQKDGLKINRLDACEFQLGLYNLLKANFKISHIENNDFMDFKPEHHYDVIIMNPPFSGMIGDKDVKNLYTYHLFRAMVMKPRLIYVVMPRYEPTAAVTKYITSKYGPIPKYDEEEFMTINTFTDFKSGVPKPLKITAKVFRLEEDAEIKAKAKEPKAAEKAKKTETPENNYSFLKRKMVGFPKENLASFLGVELTAAQKKLAASVEKTFDSPTMPDRIFTDDDLRAATGSKKIVEGVIVSMLLENLNKKYKIEIKIRDINFFFFKTSSNDIDQEHLKKLKSIVEKTGKPIPETLQIAFNDYLDD